MMDYLLKSLSLLISYPGPDMRAALPEIRAIVVDHPALLALADDLLAMEPLDAEERYVALFDRSRQLSLNLFEHIHGEGRDRGSAMVDLIDTYRAAGFDPATSELPDHLPVLLEFLALQPPGEAREVLAGAAPVLAALSERLARRQSHYAAVPAILLRLAEAQGEALAEEEDEDPDDLEALDRVWAESEVTFGPDPDAGCPAVRDVLARMDRPSAHSAQGENHA